MDELEMVIKEIVETQDVPISVPCYSCHSRLAKKIVTAFVKHYPEYKNTILALCCYPKAKWASCVRTRLRISPEFTYQFAEYSKFGLKSCRYRHQREQIEITEELIGVIDQMLSNKTRLLNSLELIVLRSVFHCEETGEDIEAKTTSKYLTRMYLKQTLEKVCAEWNEEIQLIIKKLRLAQEELCDDVQVVLHDTEILLRMLPDIERGAKSKEADDIDYKELYRVLNLCLDELEEGKILRDYGYGIPEYRIAQWRHKSRSYIRNKYHQGIENLSYVLWGYRISIFLF